MCYIDKTRFPYFYGIDTKNDVHDVSFISGFKLG